jgi:hypothetical protein
MVCGMCATCNLVHRKMFFILATESSVTSRTKETDCASREHNEMMRREAGHSKVQGRLAKVREISDLNNLLRLPSRRRRVSFIFKPKPLIFCVNEYRFPGHSSRKYWLLCAPESFNEARLDLSSAGISRDRNCKRVGGYIHVDRR